jgi:tetracycline repressor-like protein
MSRFRPARMRYIDALLRCLRDAGFSAETTYHAYHTLDSHILGFTLWELGHTIDAEAASALAANFIRDIAEDYPHLAEHAEQHLDDSRRDGVGDFEFGLDLILDGLERIRDADPALSQQT